MRVFVDGRMDRRTDANKYIISLASQSIIKPWICHWPKYKDPTLQRDGSQRGMNGLELAMNGAKYNWLLEFYSILSRTKGYSIWDPEGGWNGNHCCPLPYFFVTPSSIFFWWPPCIFLSSTPSLMIYFFMDPPPPISFFSSLPPPQDLKWNSPCSFRIVRNIPILCHFDKNTDD